MYDLTYAFVRSRSSALSVSVSRSIATGPRRVLSINSSVPVGVHQNLHFTRLVYLLGVLFVHTNNAVPAYQRIRLFRRFRESYRRFRESLYEGRVMNRREITYTIVYTKPAVNIWDALWDPAKPYKVYRVWMEIFDGLKKVNIWDAVYVFYIEKS